MTDVNAVVERWQANCHAAGVRLTESDVAQAGLAHSLEQVLAREALIVSINAASELPDYLDRDALERDDHA